MKQLQKEWLQESGDKLNQVGVPLKTFNIIQGNRLLHSLKPNKLLYMQCGQNETTFGK